MTAPTFTRAAFLCALVLLAFPVTAQDLAMEPTEPAIEAPTRVTYSGLLTDADGAPLPDGSRALVFRAYASAADAESGSAPAWQEAHDVAVVGGRFLTLLGSRAALPEEARWLTVSVDGAPASAPVALGREADGAGSGFAPGNTLQDSYDNGRFITVANGAPLQITGALGQIGFITRDVTPVFISDQLMRFRLRSVQGGRTWEYRVYGNGTERTAGTFAITDATGGGADGFVMLPGVGEDLMTLDGSTVNVGAATSTAEFRVFTTPNPLDPEAGFVGFDVRNDGNTGGESNWYTEDGVIHTRIEPDGGGTGGFFTVANGTGGAAFQVNGNNAGGSRTTLGVGTSRSLFDDAVAGDGSVILPSDAVSAAETSQEAGAANAFSGTLVTLTPGYQVLLSRTLTAPASGYVIAIASVDVQFAHTSGGSASAAEFAVTTDCDASPTAGSASDFDISIPSAVASGFYNFSASPSGMFSVPSGTTTFCLVGSELNGDATSIDHQLSLLFVPTAYGTAVSNLGDGAASAADGEGPAGRALTSSDIAAERAASVRDNEARITAELDALRARLDAIEAERAADGQQDGLR